MPSDLGILIILCSANCSYCCKISLVWYPYVIRIKNSIAINFFVSQYIVMHFLENFVGMVQERYSTR